MNDNTMINSLEVQESKSILASNPIFLYIELTQRCNCSCLMCYRSRPEFSDNNRADTDMSKTLYERIVKELFKTAEVVDLRGFGETTIYPNILELLEYNWNLYPDISYKLVTNGKSIDAELMKAMAKLRLDLYVSFDAAEKGLFEYLRRGNSFNSVVENIKKWNEVYSKDNRARLLVTLTRYNSSKVSEIAHFAANSGCRLLSFSEVDPLTGPEWVPDRDAVLREINTCLQICSSAGMDMVIPADYLDAVHTQAGWKTVMIEKCTAPWNSALIKYNGDVYSCSHRFGSMGSMIESSFGEIWNGERFRFLRSSNKSNELICGGCMRNSLAFIGTRGVVSEKTWAIIDQQHINYTSI